MHVINSKQIKRFLYTIIDAMTFRQLIHLRKFESMERLSRAELSNYQLEKFNETFEKFYGHKIHSWDQFYTLPITTKSDLPEKPAFAKLRFRYHETSGSTGEPRIIWVPAESWNRKDALFMRSWKKMGWKNEPILRLISGEPKYAWYDWFRNVKPMNYKTLSNDHVDWVVKNKPFLIHGPGGAIRQLCEMLLMQNYEDVLKDIKIHWCSESSYGHKERLVPFVAEFHEQYGLAELPTVGATDGFGRMQAVEEQAIIEIVDEFGNKVEDGQEGFIVVTDFNNFQTPIIRYKCGDRGKISKYTNQYGHERLVLKDVVGRGVDYYFGPEVKRPIGWWVVAPISHIAGDVISKWRCEIDISNKLFKLYVVYKNSPDIQKLEPYRTWIKENLGLEFEVIEAEDELFDIYWKNKLVRVL
jgi:phenylacetate-coenzyme A ligase PaaK-like adenylate-forming protein